MQSPPPLVSQWNQIAEVATKCAKTAVARSLRIHARVGRANGGGKPALVLVPGLVVSSRNVAPTGRLLQEAFSVYALDLPGFGKSDKPAKVLTVPQLAAALLAWMDDAGLPDAHLFGNSFGCQVIVEAACQQPGASDASC